MPDYPVKRSGERFPVGLRLRLSYGSTDEFIEKFAANISRGGIFIRTREPKSVGTPVVIEIHLASGERVIRGKGVVRWVAPSDSSGTPARVPGMGIEFQVLDEESRVVLDRLIARAEERGYSPLSGGRSETPGLAASSASEGVPRLPRALVPGNITPRPFRIPIPTGPITPASSSPTQADLRAAHRVERLTSAPMRIEISLPGTAEPITNPSKAIVGIDLGTTNSCAAVVRDGKPYVIPTRQGYNTLPSVVALGSRNQIMVGHLARSQLLVNPRDTVYGAKRLIGRPFDSPVVQELKAKVAYEIVADSEGFSAVRLGPVALSLEQISALVLQELKQVAQNHLGEDVNRAVITVPAYYSERQRSAVRAAGMLAGLKVERILNEPTAAALAYAHGRRLQQRLLVYDLGGGTFDASILELNDNVYEVVSTGGDTFLGGADFDSRIVERLLAIYANHEGIPFEGDRVALSRLCDAAERAKCALSESSDFTIRLPYLAVNEGRPVDFETALSREEIVQLVEPLVDRTLQVCREVLAAKSLDVGDIDEVLLVGGQSRMPLIHQKVEALFGKPPSRAVHPDEAVAIGAALLAHSLGSVEGVVLLDVLPMSLCIGLPGGRVKHIIERNTPLPARRQHALTTEEDDQNELELVVLQGEKPAVADCEYLGTLKLTGLPPGPRGTIRIGVVLEVDAEGQLSVTAREHRTGREVTAVMSTLDGAKTIERKLAAHAKPYTVQGPSISADAPSASSAATEPERPGSGLRGLLRRFFD